MDPGPVSKGSPLRLTPDENEYYERLFSLVDPDNSLRLEGKSAAKFFKKSGLPISILRRIWELSAEEPPYMDKSEFFKALKLIALTQNGKEPSLGLLSGRTALPTFNGIDCPDLFSIKDSEIKHYSDYFYKLTGGLSVLDGKQAKDFFLQTKLPRRTLKRLWELVDEKGTGQLTEGQFIVAMHLISKVNAYDLQVPAAIPSALSQFLSPQEALTNEEDFFSSNRVSFMDSLITESVLINKKSFSFSEDSICSDKPVAFLKTLTEMMGNDRDELEKYTQLNAALQSQIDRLEQTHSESLSEKFKVLQGKLEESQQETNELHYQLACMKCERDNIESHYKENVQKVSAEYQAKTEEINSLSSLCEEMDSKLSSLESFTLTLSQQYETKASALSELKSNYKLKLRSNKKARREYHQKLKFLESTALEYEEKSKVLADKVRRADQRVLSVATQDSCLIECNSDSWDSCSYNSSASPHFIFKFKPDNFALGPEDTDFEHLEFS